ncbi:hypothetical protein ILUMI_25679 [Ignelater luminosus]|uniref:Uncharacterized protein n=1 Tax=Ignelater luminosus TaxID=2038154 RepID=A0A8K0CA05_IGNLU|nr:hypothetical protein ILUMI_25679 [Ignelater luminosus]
MLLPADTVTEAVSSNDENLAEAAEESSDNPWIQAKISSVTTSESWQEYNRKKTLEKEKKKLQRNTEKIEKRKVNGKAKKDGEENLTTMVLLRSQENNQPIDTRYLEKEEERMERTPNNADAYFHNQDMERRRNSASTVQVNCVPNNDFPSDNVLKRSGRATYVEGIANTQDVKLKIVKWLNTKAANLLRISTTFIGASPEESSGRGKLDNINWSEGTSESNNSNIKSSANDQKVDVGLILQLQSKLADTKMVKVRLQKRLDEIESSPKSEKAENAAKDAIQIAQLELANSKLKTKLFKLTDSIEDGIKLFYPLNFAVQLTFSWVTAFNKEEVTLFFKHLEDIMERHQFTATKIYNSDETGSSTVQDPGTIITEKEQKRVGKLLRMMRFLLLNKAYCDTATIQKVVSGFKACEIMHIDSTDFGEKDFFASDYLLGTKNDTVTVMNNSTANLMNQDQATPTSEANNLPGTSA